MATLYSPSCLFPLLSIILLSFHVIFGYGAIDGNLYDAHATFYGDKDGGGTMRKCIYIYTYDTYLHIYNY